ncbi:hypothetical protein Droror1_Dr00000495 [Drosera rotundifolia]
MMSTPHFRGLVEKGEMESAFRLLETMVENRRDIPNVASCNKLTQGLCRVEKTSKASRVLEMLEESGEAVLPTVVTYTVMIGGYCNQGNVDKALDLLDRMMVSPNGVCYNTLLKGFCDSGELDKALELLDRMKVAPDVVSYTTLLKGLCDSGKLDRAIELLGRQLKSGCYPDVYTYNTLIGAFCEERGIEKALEFLDALRRGSNPNVVTYSILVYVFNLCLPTGHDHLSHHHSEPM